MIDRRGFVRSVLAGSAGAAAAHASALASPMPPAQEAFQDGESYWAHLRWQFLIPDDQAYCNTGTLGASPRAVVDAVAAHLRYVEESLALWDYSPDKPERLAGYRPERGLRQKLADYIHAGLDEVGLTVNATMAMNTVASGLDLRPGDEVLITDKEHPGGRTGWDLKQKRYGIVVREVGVPASVTSPDDIVRAFEAAVSPRTRVIAVPHILSGPGIIMPVQRLCALARERGIFTSIDGAQAVGHLHVDVGAMGCDAYFSSPHKWMLAPKGTGFLYIRRDVQDRIWTLLASSQWNNYADGMFRLMQWGTLNQSLLRGLEAAVDFMNAIGRDRIEQRVRQLGSSLRQGLSQVAGVTVVTPMHPDLAAGLTHWGVEGLSGRQLQDELWARRKIRVRAGGERVVRQSTHIYNSLSEIEATIAVAKALAAR
jgi:selenocysteine lyase/cysteine desulfurase